MFGGAVVAAAPPASAHPLGNFTVNRYSGLSLSPGRVRVLYVLDMAEIPAYQELPAIDTNGDGSENPAEKHQWAIAQAPRILAHLSLSDDGVAVPLRVSGASMEFRAGQAGLPILRFVATFTGPLADRSGSISYHDGNYADRIGWKEITVRSESGVAITGASVGAVSVSRELLAYPKDLLLSPLNVTTATFSFRPGKATVIRQGTAQGPTVSGAPVASGGSFAGLVRWRLTPFILAVSMLLAFGFGALHALGPGHGKTITAAYLVGAGARRSQAMLIGIGVSLMHTASVLALGLVAFVVARSSPPERVYPWLELTTGLVALGLGVGLLVSRVRARRRGEDPWRGLHHHHGNDEGKGHGHDRGGLSVAGLDHGHGGVEGETGRLFPSTGGVLVLERDRADRPSFAPTGEGLGSGPARPVSRRGLAALAVAGGILPSPTALVVLTGSISAHRIGYGLALILAFSVGLAAALVLIGLFALRARSVVSGRLTGRWAGLIPIASAAAIVGVGMFFALRGLVRIA
jgi:ABC-type nickel/cobalt efflux system permease component RcnA